MLSARIKEIRTAKKLSQVDLAKLLGVTKQSVSNWENDNIQPSVEMLLKISEALNVTTDYLLGRSDRRYLDITDLPEEAIQYIQGIISYINK